MAKFHDGLLGSFDMSKKVGVSIERLRYWEQVGILNPEYIQCRTRRYRRYSQDDMNKAIFIKVLVEDEKYSLEGAVMKFNEKETMDRNSSIENAMQYRKR
jgi:DNA-binding transcriptional MerR regulator